MGDQRMGHFLFIVMGLLLGSQVAALKIDGLGVPATVLSGDAVRFTCSFKLEGATLHSLTWLRDEEPFFRCRFGEEDRNASNTTELRPTSARLTGPELHKITYNVAGITVDVQGSTMNEVWLRRVDHRASGLITCRVVGLDYDFSDERSANFTVLDVPSEAPRIEGKTTGYILDQTLHLNCSSPPAHPPLPLVWRINSKPAPDEYVVPYRGEEDSMGRVSSKSGLRFTLRRSHFYPTGVLRIHCLTQAPQERGLSAEVTVLESLIRRAPPPSGSAGDGGVRLHGGGIFGCPFTWSVLVLLVGIQ